MRLTITIFVFLMVRVAGCIHAEKFNSTAETSDPVARRLFIDPSSTSVAPGKASLIPPLIFCRLIRWIAVEIITDRPQADGNTLKVLRAAKKILAGQRAEG
jgi:hypothetical protein